VVQKRLLARLSLLVEGAALQVDDSGERLKSAEST